MKYLRAEAVAADTAAVVAVVEIEAEAEAEIAAALQAAAELVVTQVLAVDYRYSFSLHYFTLL